MKRDPVKKNFLRDVKGHKTTVLCNEGLNRNLLFRDPNRGNAYSFNVVTWDNHLCISGDMGTFVFSRIADMFEFFRSETLTINPSYWLEKLSATDRWSSRRCSAIAEEYDAKGTIAATRQHFKDMGRRKLTEEERDLLERLDSYDSDYEAMDALYRFGADDAHELIYTKPTYHVLWCMYAIVWAIQKFDALQEKMNSKGKQLCVKQ